MKNMTFKIESFSDLKALFDYGTVLKTISSQIEKGEYVHHINLKTTEDIDKFLTQTRICQIELFRTINALAKILYHCDRAEISRNEMDTILALFIFLCETGITVQERTKNMTTENTFPFEG